MKVQKSKTKSNLRKNPFVIIAIVAAILVAGYFVAAYVTKLPPFAADAAPVFTDGVNLERTETEKAASDAIQENPESKVENEQNDTPTTPEKNPDSGKLQANVLLTNAGIYNGTVSAGGMVTNVTENSGECTYQFTQGSQKVTKTTSTLVNPTSTTCKTVSFPASELTSNGVWKVMLIYTSATSAGTSSAKDITK